MYGTPTTVKDTAHDFIDAGSVTSIIPEDHLTNFYCKYIIHLSLSSLRGITCHSILVLGITNLPIFDSCDRVFHCKFLKQIWVFLFSD